MKTRLISFVLLAVMLLSGFAAFADNSNIRAVIGADLTDVQVQNVYDLFGVRRGSCIELSVTNAEERRYLQGLFDDSFIGTRSISCVYFELLPQGSGLQLQTENITWCTPEMYAASLATAGITDAKVIVAAPFEVSGTAAVTGMFKAYEDITGKKLDSSAKQAGTQELTLAGELSESIGQSDTAGIINDLKHMLDQTKKMSDTELDENIRRTAAAYHVKLTDSQVKQLHDLCRVMEKLDVGALKSRVDKAQETLQKLGEAKDKVVGFGRRVSNFFASVRDFFAGIRAWFN